MKHSSRIDYLKRIDRVVAHVSSAIEKQEPPPSIAELARKANLSEFHFMRVYRALAGESLGTTIQRLRLSRAVYLLTRSDASIVDIAGNVGFETSQALAKALRRELGMSPSEVRERYVSRPQDLQLPTPRTSEHIPAITVEVIELEPFRVIAIRNKGAYRELNLAYGRLFAWLAERADVSSVAGIWGVPHHDRRDVPASECMFDCCIATTTNVTPDHDVASAIIGGGRFLIHRHVGSYDALDEAHDWLLREVLPMRDLALRDAPILHRFLNDPDQVPEEQLETVIHVPVL
jgi:AraC family transcriptional regulator